MRAEGFLLATVVDLLFVCQMNKVYTMGQMLTRGCIC